MKKSVLVCALCLILLITAIVAVITLRDNQLPEQYYAKSAIVSSINFTKGYVSLQDKAGNEWFWWCDTSSPPWAINEPVLLVMNNKGTEWIYDDEIISVTTEGIVPSTVFSN